MRDGTGEGGNVEGEDGLRDVVALADNFVFTSPVIHFTVTHCSYRRMFLV